MDSNLTMRYNCVALAGINKGQTLQKDADGYYYVLLGALNIFNSEGIFYAFNESKHVFDRSSVFMRKVQAGNLFGEEDHPPFEPGMSEAQWIERNEWIETKNVAMHIREVELKPTDQVCNGMPVVEIWGWIKPNRDRGPYLAEALENPHQNVCFSLRAIVREGRIGGTLCRRIDRMVTFDWVIEDGLQICNKYSAIERGSKVARESTRTFVDRPIHRRTLEEMAFNPQATSKIATESRRGAARQIAREYLNYSEARPHTRVVGLGKGSW
ncbi:head maturation protease [Erwinia phage Machina]|uniref:Putative virion structural protein n=2 Tax=Machinavirus machina TaxID=2169990 RepID=A0A1B2IDK2_9CAUD|nr:head maturation protease [Erwinia phage vB_EamM_Huxley]YP_009617175.1 head maturation protease [Erwinia phage Machina]ANZ50167.1 putative virion structural protein [Erwinia phage vB_EamM_Parshik]QOC54709.1 putative virion structural protein [Salmonella phage pSal-SNUABM-04]ANZ49339.1 putative virion structural protein [Erwinia phage vB_EamM_Huxley]ANZ49896.1 putative virion structural protein [Erwinia phage Machina]